MKADINLLGCVALFASFVAGVMFTDYHYRNIPKEVIVPVQSHKEIELNTALQLCKGLSSALVEKDAGIINNATDLIDDYTARLRLRHIDADPDRYVDIYNAMKRRDPIVSRIKSL